MSCSAKAALILELSRAGSKWMEGSGVSKQKYYYAIEEFTQLRSGAYSTQFLKRGANYRKSISSTYLCQSARGLGGLVARQRQCERRGGRQQRHCGWRSDVHGW